MLEQQPPRPRAHPLGQADWDHLLAERIAIMHEAGMTERRAQALALGDTVKTFGERPQVAA